VKKLIYLSVIIPFLFSGCEKLIYVKTPCAKVPTYDVNMTSLSLAYEVYKVFDENGTLVGKEVKGIKKNVFDRLIRNYGSYKSCCEVMNLNAIDTNRVNSAQ